jgi:dTDP-4-dehydrorhamnose 3,5-epimerase
MQIISAAAQGRSSLVSARPLSLPDLVEVRPQRHEDERGFFSEVWNQAGFAEAGIEANFVQDNLSFSRRKGVVRGLHFQMPPFAQAKLVRVSHGAIFDVGVDIRGSSPTFGQWAGVVLSAAEGNQLYVPEGFAHGFVTLEDDTEVTYKVSTVYSPAHDRAIRFDDPEIGIPWPLTGEPILSAKDAQAPCLSEIETGFG